MVSDSTDKSVGQRMTWQRRLLLDIIGEAEGHLNADELFRRAKEKDSRISLSTVYRNLQLLKELGLVKERHFLEEHHHYEITESADHCHLVCSGCGAIQEVETPLTEEMKGIVEGRNGFQVTDMEVNILGYCATCQHEQ